ncbi:hypothetical protein TD95_004222 [Thielaviopsis punctulata]|uniref:N(6)-L-threonylcarbamoyladenine synthase n=1 Tax=Thielaviopsis punctulata TaxID=72032 RepID=A0A0F4ZDF8_9PEZI|nr:hypothetical protein TD95_004222 [Thielaviopsis punctulata]
MSAISQASRRLGGLYRRQLLTNPRSFPKATTRIHTFTTLAIESSCDDTCVALLSTPDPRSSRFSTPFPARLLFHGKSTSDNRAFQGVNPPLALTGHDRAIGPLLQQALGVLREEGAGDRPDLVAVTRGPGMSANLAVGLNVAKGLAVAWGVPLVGVNHMQAHALTPRFVSALSLSSHSSSLSDALPADAHSPAFPFLTLLVSGGHTMLVHSSALTTHRILACADNIALGDALDKCARHILPASSLAACPDVMYARALESFAFPTAAALAAHAYTPPARRVDEITPRPHALGWALRPFLAGSRRLAYNFSDAESQVIHLLRARPDIHKCTEARRALAADVMRLVFEHLVGRVVLALEAQPEMRAHVKTLVVAGGVASNRFLMRVAREMLAARGFSDVQLVVPPVQWCTDNAAMIAWTGVEMYAAGYESDLSILPLRKWSVDPEVEGGILGQEGWIKRG